MRSIKKKRVTSNKKMLKIKNDIKLFWRFGLIYVLLFFVLLLFLVPIYLQTYDIARDGVVMESYRKLREGGLHLDNQINKMTEIAEEVQSDGKCLRLSGIKGDPMSKDYFTIGQVQEELVKIAYLQTVPLKTFLIFKNNPIVISDELSISRAGDFYGKAFRYHLFEAEEFYRELFDKEGSTNYIKPQMVHYFDNRDYQGFTYIVKQPKVNFAESKSMMAFMIEEKDVLALMMQESIRDCSFFYIEDLQKQEIVLSYNYSSGQLLQVSEPITSGMTIQDKEYTILSDETQQTALRIVMGIEESFFKDNINSVTRLMIVYMAAAILTFIIGCICFLIFKIKGFKELFAVLRYPDDQIWKAFDMRYLKKTFSDIMIKSDKYEKEIAEIQGIYKNTILEKLFLHGIYSDKEKTEIENILGKNIEFYCVVSVRFGQANSLEKADINLFQKISFHIVRYLEEFYYEDIVAVNNGLEETILLIPLKPTNDSYTNKISTLFEQISTIVAEEYGMELGVGISDISIDIYNMHTAYLQAKTSARQSSENQRVSEYDAIKDCNYMIDFNLGAQLYELTISGEHQGIGQLFRGIKKQLINHKLESEHDILHLYYMLRDALYHAIKDLKQEQNVILPEYDRNESVFELLDLLHVTAEEVCNEFIKKKKSKNPELKKQLEEYIHANYNNPGLCAADIAVACHIAEKYLYQYIKEHTGKTVGEYIEGIRMAKIEQLLIETEKSVSEICELAGFQSVNTFYKAFKRIYGIAPGKWRENHGK